MGKKINNKIQDVKILNNVFKNINSQIEQYCMNSKVIFLVDFFAYIKYSRQIEEIRQTSINYVTVKVVKDYCEMNNEIQDLCDDTCSFVLAIGEFNILRYAQRFAIKNNINYAFVCVQNIKSELFYNSFFEKDDYFLYFPPTFINIYFKKLNNKEKFNIYLNIYKYFYLILEYELMSSKNNELEAFLLQYINILKQINQENLLDSCVALGLLLNKHKIKSCFKSFNNDFNNFFLSIQLTNLYEIIFKKINKFSLYRSRVYREYSLCQINDFKENDYEFNKFYLLNVKEKIIYKIYFLKKLMLNLIDSLVSIEANLYYAKLKTLNQDAITSELKAIDNVFLNKMQYFEIFNI